jgi:hypothetical protein
MADTGVMSMTEIEQKIGSSFADISAVERVHVLQDGKCCTVFTIVDDEDEDVLDAIYERERALIHRHAGFSFDFNVVARRGRPLHNILTFSTPGWRSPEAGSGPH